MLLWHFDQTYFLGRRTQAFIENVSIQVSKYFTLSLWLDNDCISTRSVCNRSWIPLVNVCLRLKRCLIGLCRVYASRLISQLFTSPFKYLSSAGCPPKPTRLSRVKVKSIHHSQSMHWGGVPTLRDDGHLRDEGDLRGVVDLRLFDATSRDVSVTSYSTRNSSFSTLLDQCLSSDWIYFMPGVA